MKLKNALETLPDRHTSDTLHPMYTPWGEKLDPEHVWEEYPRPQMRRRDFHMLNGYWDYCITKQTIRPGTPFRPDGRILVPFSPEALLSGVGKQLRPDQMLWYQREIIFTDKEERGQNSRCLLHFGAVDHTASVYVNGDLAAVHSGGYLPFTVDVTDAASRGTCLVQLCVTDVSDTSYHTRGKQALKRGGMFYTAQSGIWQSVWYEWVPDNAVISLKITPLYNDAQVMLELETRLPLENVEVEVQPARIFSGGESSDSPSLCREEPFPMKSERFPEDLRQQPGPDSPLPVPKAPGGQSAPKNVITRIRLTFPELQDAEGKPLKHTSSFRPWTPDKPWLYPFTLKADGDEVESYFAMRCFTVEKGKGHPVFCLNHKPLFLHGILDQGYWSDGLMTAPCDEAFTYDIQLARSFGFNMIRKHIKIEPLRWYYHCDRLGMVVWQDMVNGGTSYHMPLVCHLPTVLPFFGKHFRDNHYRLLSRASQEGRREWTAECKATIEHLRSVPSIAVWIPFNEAWGQFDAAETARMIRRKDPSRPIDHASGWFDQKKGDFRSVHNYFRPLSVETEKRRAFVISEYGGYACHVEGHSSVDRIYGYQKYETCEKLSKAYWDLMRIQLKPLIKKGLCGAVYTQLSDIEEEVNGLVTYDRKVVKIKLPSPAQQPSDK